MKFILSVILLSGILISCNQGSNDCVEGDCYNGKGKEEDFLGYVYEGTFKNGKRHGHGSLYSEIDDVKRTGIFVNGKLEGKGRSEFGPNSVAPGGVYTGNFENNIENGRGKFVWSDQDPNFPGHIYIGEWKNGEMHGEGRYTWPNGGWLEGEFKNGYANGKATRYWPDIEAEETEEQTYTGDFVMDMQHGYGVLLWADGEKYEGGWKNGEFHGKGKYTLATGEVFEGEWIDGESEEFNAWVEEIYW